MKERQIKRNDPYFYDFPGLIAEEWFDRGCNETDDVVFKFVSYWIVFNHLYNYNVPYFNPPYERGRIIKFCNNNYNVLRSSLDFSKLDLSEFLTAPVLPDSATVACQDVSGDDVDDVKTQVVEALKKDRDRNRHRVSDKELEKRAGYIARDFCDFHGDDKRAKIIALFMLMYQVRCNLFHGNKSPGSHRDIRLVEQSVAVLEMCLPPLLKKYFRLTVPNKKED